MTSTLLRKPRIRRLLCALSLLGGFADVRAADAASLQSPPPYKQLRYDEDYSYLRDPGRRNDWLDAIKFIPLDTSNDAYLSFGVKRANATSIFITRNGVAARRITTATSSNATCCTPTRILAQRSAFSCSSRVDWRTDETAGHAPPTKTGLISTRLFSM